MRFDNVIGASRSFESANGSSMHNFVYVYFYTLSKSVVYGYFRLGRESKVVALEESAIANSTNCSMANWRGIQE